MGERVALARLIWDARYPGMIRHDPHATTWETWAEYHANNPKGFDGRHTCFVAADAILASAWLRERDAQMRAAGMEEAGNLIGAAYQIVGKLADEAGLFDHPSVIRALDALSDQVEAPDKPLLPFPHIPFPIRAAAQKGPDNA